MELKIKALSPKLGNEIPFPTYATAGSAGMDLRACIDESVTVPAGERRMIPTGLAIALPGPEWVALLHARSGLAIKHGLCRSHRQRLSGRGGGGVAQFLWGELHRQAWRADSPAGHHARDPGPYLRGGGVGRDCPGRGRLRLHREKLIWISCWPPSPPGGRNS